MKTRTDFYNEGWKAAWNGLDKDTNPYAEYSSNYSHWNDGWNDGWINAKRRSRCCLK